MLKLRAQGRFLVPRKNQLKQQLNHKKQEIVLPSDGGGKTKKVALACPSVMISGLPLRNKFGPSYQPVIGYFSFDNKISYIEMQTLEGHAYL